MRDGDTIFIADPEKARKQYEEQWGVGDTKAAAPSVQPQQQQQQQPEEEEEKGDNQFLNLLRRNIGTGISLSPLPGAPILGALSQVPVDKEGTTAGEEAARIFGDAPRRVVSDIAAATDIGATLSQGASGGILGPIPKKGQGPEELRAEEEKAKQQTAVALEALQKTGKDPQGFSYGIRPSVPILGPLFSEEGGYAQAVGPKTAAGKLASSVLAAILFDRGVSAAFKAPSTGTNITKILKAKDVATGLRSMGSYFVKELVPDVVQDAMFFLPDAPTELQAELKDIRALETEEERLLRIQALVADDDNDFDFFASALEEIQTGAFFSIGLRASLKAGNEIVRNLAAGVEPGKAIDAAADTATKQFEPQLELEAQEKLKLQLEENIGNSTAQLHNRIDENIQNVAFGARAGAESYLQKQEEFIPNLDRIQGELNEIPDVAPQLTELQQQVSSLQKTLSVTTPEQIAAKRTMLSKRLAEYEKAVRKDPEWINKSTGTGKKRSRNRTKFEKALRAAENLQQLEVAQTKFDNLSSVEASRVNKLNELDQASATAGEAFIPFNNAINDARILVNGLDELSKQRQGFLEARNAQMFRENRLDEIDRDYRLPGPYGEAYGELKELVETAEIAVASGNVNPEFVKQFVKRADEIHNKVIENGGLAPTFPELPASLRGREEEEVPKEIEEALKPEKTRLEPKAETPFVNNVPVTKQNDEIVIDTDAQINPIENAIEGDDIGVSPEQMVRATKQYLDLDQNPTATKETLEEFEKYYGEVTKNFDEVFARTNDEEIAAKAAYKIRNTNAKKYTEKLENAPAIAAVIKSFDRQRILSGQYAKAFRTALTFQSGPGQREMRMIASYAESQKLGKDIQQNLNKIMVPVATLESNAAATLAAARDLRKIYNNEPVEGLDRITAQSRFANQFSVFVANARALDELFYGVGTALRTFAQKNRIQGFKENAPELLFNEFNRQLLKQGNADVFSKSLAEQAKTVRKELDQGIGTLFNKVKKGEDLTPQEIEGLENLVEKVYESGGNLENLKAIEMTADGVLANLQIGGPLSNPATIASIPIQGVPETALELTGQAVSGTITGKTAQFLGKNEIAKENLTEARLASETLLQFFNVIEEALDITYKRFVYGKAITDPNQAADAAYQLRRQGGLRREEQIAQDLKAEQIKIPFTRFVLEKSKTNPEIYDAINKARVFTKVFHDYMAPGEAWNKRGLLTSIVGLPTTMARNLTGLGTKSYYAGGENVNLSLFGQLASTADEFSTAIFANARRRALAVMEVDEAIASGTIKMEDRADEIKKVIADRTKSIYQPVKVGFDQETIGYSIMDEQILELTRAVNLTTELTGMSKGVENSINELRKSKHPVLATFGRDIFPFLVSPINGIKRAVKISYGGEIIQFGADVTRLGLQEARQLILPKGTTEAVKKFESKYFHSDPKIRIRAQGSLALAVGIQSLAWFLVRDGNQDITGGLENTYRETEGARDPYTIKVGGMMIPYRYLPLFGNALALQANMRDFQQFSNNKGFSDVIGLGMVAMANTILETPALAGFEKAYKAFASMKTGDPSRVQKLIANAISKTGDPYLNLRKVIIQGVDPAKPASPITRYVPKSFYEQGNLLDKGIENPLDFTNNVWELAGGGMGVAIEYSSFGVLADAIATAYQGAVGEDENIRLSSRKALWYGKPGETINANHAGKWYPLQAALGRYWPFPDKLETDVVAKEMVYNLIEPPRNTVFNGVTVNQSVLNDFNHFLNSEAVFYDANDKRHVGMHSALKSLIESPFYQSLPSVDSPFKQVTAQNPLFPLIFQNVADADWDRKNNQRAELLRGERDKLISRAKDQFLFGENPGQIYKAPEELKQLVLELRGGLR
tara:strand:- start:2554 stop:8136 length:5583 start_codon:yes stop_codon:yes gene_type:complete